MSHIRPGSLGLFPRAACGQTGITTKKESDHDDWCHLPLEVSLFLAGFQPGSCRGWSSHSCLSRTLNSPIRNILYLWCREFFGWSPFHKTWTESCMTASAQPGTAEEPLHTSAFKSAIQLPEEHLLRECSWTLNARYLPSALYALRFTQFS